MFFFVSSFLDNTDYAAVLLIIQEMWSNSSNDEMKEKMIDEVSDSKIGLRHDANGA
jgi:hypothetical protein